MDWHPIETLKLHPSKCSSFEEISDEVMFWVSKSEYGYTGPIVGSMIVFHKLKRDGTSFVSFEGAGFSGHEWEWDFNERYVTHWAELPKGPGE